MPNYYDYENLFFYLTDSPDGKLVQVASNNVQVWPSNLDSFGLLVDCPYLDQMNEHNQKAV